MSNAIERARKLKEELSRLKARKTEQNKSEHFETRREELRQVRIQLDPAVATLLVLARRGRIVADALPRPGTLMTDIDEVTRRARDEAPEAITKGQEYARLYEGALKLADDLDEVVDRTWVAFRAELPAVSAIPLTEIAQIPGQAAGVDLVRRLDDAVKRAAQKPPLSDAEFDALIAQVEELRAGLDHLSEQSFPPAVRRFVIEALRPTGADRALLTSDVLEWLAAHQLAHRLRLRLFEEPLTLRTEPLPGGGKR